MSHRGVDAEDKGSSCLCAELSEEYGSLSENGGVKLVDKTDLFGYGDKFRRGKYLSVGILDTRQSFKAAELMSHIELRLQMEEQGVVFQGVSYLAFDLESTLGLEQVGRKMQYMDAAPASLYLGQCGICIGEQRIGSLGVGGVLRIAEACCYEEVTAVNGKAVSENGFIVPDSLHYARFGVITADNEHIFVAVHTGYEVESAR